MSDFLDLSLHRIISIEIGTDCNMKFLHKECPINFIERGNKNELTIGQICNIIDDAERLNFDGYIAFHHYNEPLLYMDRIMDVLNCRPGKRYLLWSNGTLIDEIERKGYNLEVFDKIVFTCYDQKYEPMLNRIGSRHKDVEIGYADMDERLQGYESTYENRVSCKKLFYELPINSYGEVFLCAHDWKNSYKLGNVNITSLYDIIRSSKYQELLRMSKKIKLSINAPEICKTCKYAYLTYHKSDKMLLK